MPRKQWRQLMISRLLNLLPLPGPAALMLQDPVPRGLQRMSVAASRTHRSIMSGQGDRPRQHLPLCQEAIQQVASGSDRKSFSGWLNLY